MESVHCLVHMMGILWLSSIHYISTSWETSSFSSFPHVLYVGKVMGMGTHHGLWVWVQVGVGVATMKFIIIMVVMVVGIDILVVGTVVIIVVINMVVVLLLS